MSFDINGYYFKIDNELTWKRKQNNAFARYMAFNKIVKRTFLSSKLLSDDFSIISLMATKSATVPPSVLSFMIVIREGKKGLLKDEL